MTALPWGSNVTVGPWGQPVASAASTSAGPPSDFGTTEQKRRFAEAYVRTGDRMIAAQEAFEHNPWAGGHCLMASSWWHLDHDVLRHMASLNLSDEERFPADRVELARKVYALADMMIYPEDRIKAYKLYADICGYIDKPGSKLVDNSHKTINNIMMLPGLPDDWEAKFAESQRMLVQNARSDIDRDG